jgi:hypothetical protein
MGHCLNGASGHPLACPGQDQRRVYFMGTAKLAFIKPPITRSRKPNPALFISGRSSLSNSHHSGQADSNFSLLNLVEADAE